MNISAACYPYTWSTTYYLRMCQQWYEWQQSGMQSHTQYRLSVRCRWQQLLRLGLRHIQSAQSGMRLPRQYWNQDENFMVWPHSTSSHADDVRRQSTHFIPPEMCKSYHSQITSNILQHGSHHNNKALYFHRKCTFTYTLQYYHHQWMFYSSCKLCFTTINTEKYTC
jgi:hypothetical protein